uniref:MAT1-1-1 n=1 Tax=Ophiognomonia clavigignenti-juglandacearum TaxID=218668 RepID=A0A2P1NR36_9PEZI|nr:MAT1-1-1 [Ophiognomonia clavigignenti-juglandacearum]
MRKHKIQKKSNIQVGSKVITAKKAVNGYIIFRSAMSALFPACTQSQRSTFVRIMWEKEQHKTSYSLIGKVWTHIRNNTHYRDLPTFITGAQRICGVVPTDEFFSTHNLSFFQHPDNTIELLQTMPVGPDTIPLARDLSDFQLLNEMLESGLPVDSPTQLGKSMGEHSLHIMTMNQKSPVFANFIQASFTPQVDADPVTACAQLLHLDSNNSLFDAGVNVVECEDITRYDTSNVLADGTLHRRFEWDTTTAHVAAPECISFDLAHFEDNPKVYDICHQPNMLSTVTGQTTQHEFLTALPDEDKAKYDTAEDDFINMDEHFNLDEFFIPTAFEEDFPSFDLD